MADVTRPKIFISYSRRDDSFVSTLTRDLSAAGAEVITPETGVRPGDNFVQRINELIASCDFVVLVLTRDALQSTWVKYEMSAAMQLSYAGRINRPLIVQAEQTSTRNLPPYWQSLLKLDATASYEGAVAQILQALQLPISPSTLPPIVPKATGRRDTRDHSDDDFQATAFYAKEAKVDTWENTLLVYAHLVSALADVRQDASTFKQQLGNYKDSTSGSLGSLPRGTQITLIPRVEGVRFDPESVSFAWTEPWHRAVFRYKPAAHLAGDVARGEVTVIAKLDGRQLPISSVRLAMSFGEASSTDKALPDPLAADTRTYQEAEGAESKGFVYQSVFASYAHEDVEIVRHCRRSYEAIGIKMHIDYVSLRTGQHFAPAIMKLIDSSDIFQLYWSANAAASEWVSREWEYAIQKYPIEGFIRPLYWDEPMTPPPPRLGHIHFARLELR